MNYILREITINENDETGIQSISFVDRPAIETDFEYFAAGKLLPFFKYTAYPLPEIISTSHNFCRNHAGMVYHESEIKSWHKSDELGWIDEANFFQNFTNDLGGPNFEGNYSFNCDSQLYNCRHKLVRISKKEDIPNDKRFLSPDIKFEQHFIKMEMISEPKREVMGLVLKSNQFIYRRDVDGNGNPGYIYFCRDTIRKLKEKYGYNRNISYMHRDDLTGQAILMDSWLEEDESLKETRWHMKYKIIGEKLWELISNKILKGFSIEAIFAI